MRVICEFSPFKNIFFLHFLRIVGKIIMFAWLSSQRGNWIAKLEPSNERRTFVDKQNLVGDQV